MSHHTCSEHLHGEERCTAALSQFTLQLNTTRGCSSRMATSLMNQMWWAVHNGGGSTGWKGVGKSSFFWTHTLKRTRASSPHLELLNAKREALVSPSATWMCFVTRNKQNYNSRGFLKLHSLLILDCNSLCRLERGEWGVNHMPTDWVSFVLF